MLVEEVKHKQKKICNSVTATICVQSHMAAY